MASFTALLLVAVGGFAGHHVGVAIVVAESIAGGFIVLRLAAKVFLGEQREEFQRIRDVSTVELGLLVPLAMGIVIYGVLPGRVIPVIEATAKAIATRIAGGQ
jgi:NADH:ubiquinone oxidoreductase subunit 4 (subunit M)